MGPEAIVASVIGAIAGSTIALILSHQRSARRRQRLIDSHLQALAAAAKDHQQQQQHALASARESFAATVTAQLEIRAQEGLKRQREELSASFAREQTAFAAEKAQAAESEGRLERREQKLAGREETIAAREESVDRKLDLLDRRDTKLRDLETSCEERQRQLEARAAALAEREQSIDDRLAAIAGLTPEQARAELMAHLDASLAEEQAKRISRHEQDYTARAKEMGIEIIGRAIQRYAAEHTAETTSAKIHLADEELKGRIIGKDGRNIKAFEQATGVDLIIDDTPQTITISCFSGVRREIAKRTLEELLADGRIQPARIEEVLLRKQQDLDREVMKLGEDAAYQCEVSGLHPQLLKLLGKLQYRTSYGQNVLKHTQEVAFLCAAMAADLGLDPKLGRRCGLMHDIGKAIDHEQEGSHPELGYEALKRYGENEIVANAALAHHEGHAVLSAYTTLAAAADAISAARPGARSENVERYIKRLEQLEDIACSFKGVQKAYAIQAGRELRVIVNGHTLGDGELAKVGRDIARRIEDEVAYPGEVKVTIIRETRHIAVAR